MKFSEYRRLREREEQEQNTGTDAGALSAIATKQTTGKKFTDIMKEREPERYERMVAERRESNIADFTNRFNQHVTDINTQITDAVDYISKNKDIYNLDADDNVERRHAEYETLKQQGMDLIKEANNNPYIDTKLREQAYDVFLNSLQSMEESEKANNAYSDYMKQFENKEAFERIRAEERKQEELKSLSAEELQQRILDAENNLDAVKEQDKVSTKTMGFKALQEHMQTQNANKKQLENDIQCYKNELFSRQQSEALEKLSDETKAAFEEFYVLQNEGYNKDASGFEKVLDNLSGGSHVVVQRAYEDQAKEKAILELEKQGISKEEFESLYEYYKFARDEEENTTKVKEWNQEYENAGAIRKIGMNAATIATAPVKGVTALQETVDSLHYENPYAPLNINSANYELTNYTDTVRNATSQDINNDKLNFLYQTGMSMADMATLLPLSGVSGGASLALMGTNAGTSAAKEATLRGASKEQALMTGLAAGGAEVVFEKLSLDHFWDIARHQGKAATRNAFINILAQAGIEGTEEVATDLANHFTDELINRGLSEWYQNMDFYYKQGMTMTEAQKAATADYCKQLGSSFLGGFLSGGAFGIGGVVNISLAGKKSTMTADDYMQIAEGIDTERNSYMSQEDYDTAMGVQQLAQTLSKKEKVTDFEKGLFEQESSRMENINWFNNPKEQIRQISERMPNETVSRAFIADYKDGMPVDTYARAFDMFYKAGYNELTFEQALSTSDAFEAVIGKPTLYAIHSLGMNQAAEASKTFTNTEQKELVNTMAKALGVTVQYQDIPGANGMYKDGMIYISNNTINPSMVVMSHELTHHLKANVTEEYATYENYVIDYFKEFHTKEYDSLYKAMTEQYGNDDALIREEIAANAAETFLTDSEAVNRFVKQNRTIAEKIADFLDNFIAKLKELYQGYKAQGKAGKMLAEDIEVYEKARDLWYDAVNAKERSLSQISNESSSKLSLKGVNEDGIEIYETSDNIKTMSIDEKKKEIINIIREQYRGRTAKFDIGEKTYYAFMTGDSVRKGIYGDKKSDGDGYTAKLNVAGDGNYFELVEHALYSNSSENLNNKKAANNIHKKSTSWDYFIKQVSVDGALYDVLINVADNGKKQFVYDVTLKKAHQAAPKVNNQRTFNQGELFDNSIPKSMQNNNQKFSFKGVNAAENDFTALSKAEEMEKSGKKAFEIFHETGWFRGADGKWRFEIDDSEAEVFIHGDVAYRNDENYHKWQNMWLELDFDNPELENLNETYSNIPEPQYLSDYLVHDALYKNYPFLEWVKVNRVKTESGVNGYANYSDGEINVDKMLFDKYTKEPLKRVLLHEIQHMIQRYEHFARGANTSTWNDINIVSDKGKLLDSIEKYEMTAGEIEARDTADRMNLTDKERRDKFPVLQTKDGVIFAENKENPFEPKFSLKSYTDELGLRFSDKDGGDLFESILMGTDNVDYQSVLVDDGSESYRATMDLIHESARILQDGITAAGKLKDFNVTRDMAQAMAAHYLNKYSATFDEDTLTNNLFNIFAYMQNTEDVNYQDMIRLMQEVCKPVIATSQKIDKELMKQYNEFRKFVRSYHIKLNEAQKAEIANVYDSFRTFKNVNQNKYTFRENGSYLDSVWSQLVEASGYALSYDTPSSEQMLALHDYMITLEKSITSPAEDMDNSQLAYDMALNIYTDYFKLIGENKQAIKNLRTQMQKKLNEYKRDVREDYKDRFKKYKEETNIKTQDEINRLQKQIRQLEHERDDALYTVDDITVNILDGNINALEYKIGKLSQRNADKLAKLTAQSYNRSVQRAITRQQTEIKNHIKKNMFDLQNRLAKPKENKFIPQGLVKATIDLCEAVNIDTGKSQRLAERLGEMSQLYARMKDDKDYALSSEYDEQTQKAIDRLREVFTGRNITMLNLMELKEVDSLITQLRFQIVNASKLIGMEKSREVYETAVKCMDEIKAAKSYNPDSRVSRGLNKYNSMMLNPKRQFRRMSGYKDDSVLNQIYEDLNNGQQKQMQVLMETARIFDPVTKGNHNQKCISALVGKEKKDWIDIGLNYKNMDPVMVPRAFRVSLAMHLQNKANLDHIIYGGLTIPEPKAYQRGDYATAYATGTTVHFIPAEADTAEKRQQAYHDAVNKLKSVVAQMTPYEKAMVKCAEKFFHEYTGEKINETSLQLNGYKKARVHNYFPIRTDSNFRPTEIEGLIRNAAIENMGMLNTRVGARNPILLEDITKVIQRQSENVAKYYGLAIPIRNFNKIYNTTKIGYQDSTKSVIARKWGVTGQKYIEDLITDLQTKRGGESTILDTLQGNFAQSVLSGNLSVAAQQVVAYPTAAATLGWDAVVKGMKYIPTKLDMEHIAKYTPLLWYRNQGTGTQEIGDVHKSKDLMSALASKATTALEHHNMEQLAWLSEKGERLINWEMELLQRIDTKAVGSLWKASEIYVRNTKKITPEQGEDSFYHEVAKVFNNCIDDTQANYSTMQRPDILRNPSKAWKMIFLFKTQPLQNFGIMYDAFGNLRAKAEAHKNSAHLDEKGKLSAEQDYIRAKKEFSRAITSQLAAATGVFAMKFLANVITYRMGRYRNKEDEITGWKIVEELLNEVISNMAGSVLGGSEVYNFINSIFTDDKYYGVGIGVIDSFNDFTNSLLKMIEDPEWDNLKQLYFDAGVLIGVPGENMYKFVSGISKHWTDMTDGKDGYFNVGHETKLSVQYTTMMNALVEGDAEKYEKCYADTLESLRLTKDEDDAKAAITSGIKTKLREYYLESEITYEDAIMILEKLGDKEPYFTVKKWDNADNKEYNKYSELETAVNNGQGIDEEIEELIDNGVREENVNMKLMNIVKEGYIHGDISKERASQYLKQYKTDYTDEDVYWELRKWDKSGSYDDGEEYSKYDDLINAVESANFESVVKEYVEHGTDASTIKQQISEKYRPMYQEAYLKADYKTLQKIKDILNKLRVNGKRIYTPDDYVGWNKQAKKEEKEKKE